MFEPTPTWPNFNFFSFAIRKCHTHVQWWLRFLNRCIGPGIETILVEDLRLNYASSRMLLLYVYVCMYMCVYWKHKIHVISYHTLPLHRNISFVILINILFSTRVLWAVGILAALGLCVTYITLRTLVYYDYETNVKSELIYPDKQPFPAVTICNQNTFRYVNVYWSALAYTCNWW